MQTIFVTVHGDANLEGDERFFVTLSQPNGLTISDSQAVATILNDDGISPLFNLVPIFNQKIEPNVPLPDGYGIHQDTGGHVNLHNGEFTERATDLVIPGRGLDWEFTRSYRSGITFDGPMGQNWDFSDNRRLVAVNALNLTFSRLTFSAQRLAMWFGWTAWAAPIST